MLVKKSAMVISCAAGDLLSFQTSEVGNLARLDHPSHRQAHHRGNQCGGHIVDHDPHSDAAQGLEVLLGGNAGDNRHQHHGNYDHLDAVEPDGTDKLQLHHNVADDQAEDRTGNHCHEHLGAQANFLTRNFHFLPSLSQCSLQLAIQ